MFKVLDGEIVVLYGKGVWYQTTVHEYKGRIFAKRGAGFIGLYKHGATTQPDILWKDITIEHIYDDLGKMLTQ